eukprot:SAG11_NODE_6992_length_1212_cov_1.233603_1_plen_399_part_10
MLMGVSRQYKESTNCRLEAQYAMQREVEVVPLMLSEGYQADGWLGFMIGTRLWFGFYGAVVSTEGLFEGKMSELCRELGSCGRGDVTEADTAVVSSAKVAEDDGAGVAELRVELHGLKMRELRKRALASGLSAEAVEDAHDADDVKGALISLLLERHAEVGAAGEIMMLVGDGGEAASELIVSVLEHAADVLEAVSASTPRKGRKAVRALLERVEAWSEMVDAAWAKDVSRCGGAFLEKLASVLGSVRELAAGECEGKAVVERVSELLECLVRCGSAVLQSVAVLEAAESKSDDRVRALDALRGLCDELQEGASPEEVSAVSVVLLHMGVEHGRSVRVSAGLALFCLGSRNGFAVCESVELIRSVVNHFVDAVKELGSGNAEKETWAVCSAMAASNVLL